MRDSQSVLWQGYAGLASRQRHLAMRRVGAPSEIFPVFHDLFSKRSQAA
jgi:hypothetical protein